MDADDEQELAVDLSEAAPTRKLLAARTDVTEQRLVGLAQSLTQISQAVSSQTLQVASPGDKASIDIFMASAHKLLALRNVLTGLISLRLSETYSNRYDSVDFFFGSIIDEDGFDSLEDQVIPLNNSIPDMSPGVSFTTAPVAFLEAARNFDNFLSTWRATYQSRAVALLREGVASTKRLKITVSYPPEIAQLLARSTVEQISELADTAHDKVEELAVALGDAGRLTLTEAFVDAQMDTKNLSKNWSIATFVCVVIGVGISGTALLADAQVLKDIGGSSGLIIKGLTGVPFFALSVFCGRVAGHYREVTRYLLILIAQLKTVAAYANNLEKAQRDDLVFKLGERAFGNPAFTVDPGKSNVSVDDLKSIVDKVAKIVGDGKGDGKGE